jgi:hypothetical protein
LARILIAVGDADGAAEDSNVEADAEVLGHEGRHAIGLEHHLALKEGALRHARVHNLGLSHHNALVLQEVEDGEVVNAEVLEAALDDSLLEVAGETEHLYNK